MRLYYECSGSKTIFHPTSYNFILHRYYARSLIPIFWIIGLIHFQMPRTCSCWNSSCQAIQNKPNKMKKILIIIVIIIIIIIQQTNGNTRCVQYCVDLAQLLGTIWQKLYAVEKSSSCGIDAKHGGRGQWSPRLSPEIYEGNVEPPPS